MEVWVSRDPTGNPFPVEDTGRSALASTLLEVTINPIIEPKDPSAGSPQAKQLPGRECKPTYLQVFGLKLY